MAPLNDALKAVDKSVRESFLVIASGMPGPANGYSFRGTPLPIDLQDSLARYIEHGILPGGFLHACLENDLTKAVNCATEEGLNLLPVVVGYLYHRAPMICWGSDRAVSAWGRSRRRAWGLGGGSAEPPGLGAPG